MAGLLFGAATPAATTFGASTPAFSGFGAAPAASGSSLFGAASTPASTSAFGFSGFGAATTAAPAAFGAPAAASAPAVGFGATTSAFGTLGAGIAASSPALLGAASPLGAFGSTGAAIGVGAASPWGGGLTTPAPAGGAGYVTKDGRPIVYSTKWDDMAAPLQQELQRRAEQYREARERCRVLDGNERLKDSPALQKTLEEEATSLSTSLRGLATQLEADDTEIGALRDEVQDMLRDTEVALATFGRSKLRHDNPEYAMLPAVMPDAYLQRTAARLQATAVQYQKVVEDLEQVLTVAGQSPSAVNAHALPGILANQHQYLLHIAAKVEAMHVRVADAKHAALHVRRAAGDQRDPFHEAAVRHQAALRAAQAAPAKPVPTPATTAAPAAALAAPPAGFPAITAPATASLLSPLGAAPAVASTAGLGGFGAFGAAKPVATLASPASGSLFGAPTSAFGAAPATPAFGAAATSAFGAAATPAFGAAPAATTPNLGAFGGFGAPAPATTATKSKMTRSTGSRRQR